MITDRPPTRMGARFICASLSSRSDASHCISAPAADPAARQQDPQGRALRGLLWQVPAHVSSRSFLPKHLSHLSHFVQLPPLRIPSYLPSTSSHSPQTQPPSLHPLLPPISYDPARAIPMKWGAVYMAVFMGFWGLCKYITQHNGYIMPNWSHLNNLCWPFSL